MATVGQLLISPENGWKRYDDTNSKIITSGFISAISTGNGYTNDTRKYVDKTNIGMIQLTFYGTKFRLLGDMWSDANPATPITIDGVNSTFNQTLINQSGPVICYEKTGLTLGLHTVSVNFSTSYWGYFDAIDIDDTGYLVIPLGTPLTAPEAGWQRIDNTNPKIVYEGSGWSSPADGTYFNSTKSICLNSSISPSYTFTVLTDKLRILAGLYDTYSDKVEVKIDGIVVDNFSLVKAGMGGGGQCLVYEKLDLEYKKHIVTVTKVNQGAYSIDFNLDAIDISDTGDILTSVGNVLITPESGWRRYDDSDSRILYDSNFKISNYVNHYNGATHVSINSTGNANSTIKIKFFGTKLRIIVYLNDGTSLGTWKFSDAIKVLIDGMDCGTFSEDTQSSKTQILAYEKTNLANTMHTVNIVNQTDSPINLDAIDIDSTGYLVHPTLNQVSNLLDMTIGDCIPCRYTATTSGSAGYFSELGTCVANEIPITGTPTPDGLFYLIKTAKGTLVADRVLQTSISWDALNSARFIEGKTYNGNVLNSVFNTSLPSSNGFTLMSSGTPGVITGNEWCLNEANSWGAYSYQNSSVINPTSTYSFETRGRVLQGNWYIFDIYDGTKRHGIYATPTSIIITGNDPISIDMTIDRTIKLITHGQNGYELYVDNVLLKTYNSSSYISTSTYTNCIMFGNLNSSDSTICYVKYFKIHYGVLLEKDGLIHSLSGGCAYADANGNESTTDVSKGAWPATNEWDKYIVNSDLGGKIIPEDVNIWHHFRDADKGIGAISWCRNTPITGIGPNTNRILRGRYTYASSTYSYKQYVSNSVSSTITTAAGFRPVLEFMESDSKQTNLWY